MKLSLALADLARWLARISAILAVLLIFLYLLFGIKYAIAEGVGSQIILAYSFPLLAVSMGLILAYWNEKIGSIVGFVSFTALFIMIGASWGLKDVLEDFSPSFILLIPVGLFSASWLLRTKR